MAIIKVGAPLSGIRGTIGGITYSANKGGPYAKQWAMPTNPQTQNQTTERGFLARKPSTWRALSGAQQAAWDTFAALAAQELFNSLGESYFASGFNWFTKCNIRLDRTARANITATPTQARPAAPTIDAFRITVEGTDVDLCVGGTPSASSEDPTFPASKAFDDSLANPDRWVTPSGTTTGWIEYQFAATQTVRKFRVYPPSGLTTAPLDWTFERFDAPATWTILQTISSYVFTADTWADFYVPNQTTSTRYRLNISANNGSATRLSIREIEMLTGEGDGSVVIYPEDEFADSPDYDLILHVSMLDSTGAQIASGNFLEVLASQTPGRTFINFQDEIEAAYGTILAERAWFARLYRQTQEGIRSAAQAARTETLE